MSAFHIRPECPYCQMAMITVSKSFNSKGDELRLFECLRCGNGDPEKVIQRKPKTVA